MTTLALRQPARNRRLRLWLILGTVVAAASVVPALFVGLPMMPSSIEFNARIWTAFLMTTTFPLALVLCPVGAWIAWALRWEKVSWTLLFLPLVWVFVVIALVVISVSEPTPI